MASGHKYKRLDSLRGLAAISVGAGHALLCVQFAQGSALAPDPSRQSSVA